MKKIIIFLLFTIISCNESSTPVFKKDKYYDKAYTFLSTTKKDSAFYYFNKAKESFIKNKESIRAANCLVNMSIIQTEKGDYFGAQENSLSVFTYLNEDDKNNYIDLISNYNNLGISCLNLREYEKSIIFYKKAVKFSKDSIEKIVGENNVANSYRYLKKYDSAIIIYKNLLKNLKVDTIQIYPRIIDNLAFTKFLQNPNYDAEPELNKALEIRENIKDLWGQNASHAHLSEYFAKKDINKSLFHAHKMYEIATQLKSPDDRLEALQKLVLIENHENSQKFFLEYQNLNDSVQTTRSKAKNQFALIRYETEKSKADLLKSQAENAQNKYKILKRNILVFLLFSGLIGFYIWFRKRQKRLLKEKELEVKNTQLKYSKKVHDVVANGLYQAMVEIQNKPEINKENLLDKLETLYENSRDISHDDLKEKVEKKFNEKLSEKLTSFSSETTKIIIVGNSENFWSGISLKIQNEIFYILQELMVNMKKHSSATLVSLKFSKENNFLKINYQDNGLGISDLENFNGKGLQNTENRIATIGGEINFEKNPKGGLIIHISIPI